MHMIPVTLKSTIKRMKREIIEDVLAGYVPVDCASFASLHDHRDANIYGGFGDDELSNSMIEHFGGRDKDEGMPDGFVNYMNLAQEGVNTWLQNGGLAMDCPPPGWKCVDPDLDDPFDRLGIKPYTSMYEKRIGGNGHPTCDLTVLLEGNTYRPAHGSIVMAERVGSAKAAADIAMTWAVENGWSKFELSKANVVGNEPPIPAFSASPDHVMRPKATREIVDVSEPATMFIATFDSRSFEFTALGTTHDMAQAAMVRGLEAHTAEKKLAPDWWSVDDINIDACPVGGCLRDHELLTGPGQGLQGRGPLAVVNEGTYSGQVLSVANGVVKQKINRAGDTVQHDIAKLSTAVQVGDVVDIQYRGGQGFVSGIGKGVGVGR